MDDSSDRNSPLIGRSGPKLLLDDKTIRQLQHGIFFRISSICKSRINFLLGVQIVTPGEVGLNAIHETEHL